MEKHGSFYLFLPALGFIFFMTDRMIEHRPKRLFLSLPAAGVFLYCLLVCSVGEAGSSGATYRTGLRRATPAERSLIESMTVRVETVRPSGRVLAGTLPSSIKNITYLPVVRNQQLSNCGAFAPSYYYKTYQEAREHGWTRPDPEVNPERAMSPGFTFPLSNGGVNNGADPFYVMALICRYGIASWAEMPESILDWVTFPNERQWRAALPYRGASMFTMDLSTTAGLIALKQHLAGGDLAIMNCNLFYDTHQNYPAETCVGVNNGVIYNNGSSFWDYHTFTLVGYDDNKAYNDGVSAKTGAFLAVNSWGPSWGVTIPEAGSGGFVWFSYDYVQNKRGKAAGSAGAMIDRINYKPMDVAVYDLDHRKPAELSVKILAGPLSSPAGSLAAFPSAVALRPFKGRVVVDVTDAASANPYTYWLQIEDYFLEEWGVTTGTVTHFEVQRAGLTTLTAQAVPVGTKDDGIIQICAGLTERSEENTFSDLTFNKAAAAWADCDRNGYPDLAVSGVKAMTGNTSLFLNTGSGVLTDTGNLLPAVYYSSLAWGDYNGDGLADLAVFGYTGDVLMTKLYRNAGSAKMMDSGIALPPVSNGTLAWGDYDNDGDLDLAMTGLTQQGVPPSFSSITKIYRNDKGKLVDSGVVLPGARDEPMAWGDANNDGLLDLALGSRIMRNNGNGTFTQAATVECMRDGALAWGDYNNDGRLDLVTAYYNTDVYEMRACLYRNDGNFAFTDTLTTLPGMMTGSFAWGDFDNDGRLDLAMAGAVQNDWGKKTTAILVQQPDGSFRDMGADIPGSSEGCVAWADVDADGDLDIFVTGDGEPPNSGKVVTALYNSSVANIPGKGKPNTRPAVPTGLIEKVGANAQTIKLQWTKGIDAETPSLGLSYNVRIGTGPGRSDIRSPQAGITLLGNHPRPMIGATQPGVLLKNLPVGRYYWSVQTIDGGLATSDWASERMFVISSGGLMTGDVNRDGVFDVADVVYCQNMVDGKIAKDTARSDANGDGVVDAADPWSLAELLAGGNASDYMTVVTKNIGPSGGKISGQGFELTVPSQCFSTTVSLELGFSPAAQPFGAAGMPQAYRIAGLPYDNKKPLTLRVLDKRGKTTTPFIGLGTRGFALSAGEQRLDFRIRKAAKMSDGYASCTLPALAGANGVLRVDAASDWSYGYGYVLICNLIYDDQWEYIGNAKWKIVGPATDASYAALPLIANDLEEAYGKYQTELGLNVTKRDFKKFPLEVTVQDLGLDKTGAPYDGLTDVGSGGTNDGYILLNTLNLSDRAAMRSGAVHELFHVIQNLHDPSTPSQKRSGTEYQWLDEATATWAEELFVAKPNEYKSNNYLGEKGKIFVGLPEGLNVNTGRYYGYGMASLIKYLVSVQTPKVIGTIYNKVAAGKDSFTAVNESTQDSSQLKWWDSTFTEIFKGNVYGWGIADLTDMKVTPANHLLVIKSDNERSHSFPKETMKDLSALVYLIGFYWDYKGLTDDDSLAFKVKGDLFKRLTVHKKIGDTCDVVGTGDFWADEGASRCIIPGAKQLADQKARILALVTNTKSFAPYNHEDEVTVDFGIVRDYNNFRLTSTTVVANSYLIGTTPAGFPSFLCTSSFSADAAGGFKSEPGVTTGGGNYVRTEMDLWGRIPSSVDLTCTAAPPILTKTVFTGGGKWTVLSIKGVKFYRLNEYTIGEPWTPWDLVRSIDSASGSFSFSVGQSAERAYYVLEVHYDLKVEDYVPGGTIERTATYPGQVAPATFWLNHK